MENNKNFTYLDVIKRIEEIFPLPTEFDYRTTNAKEIGAKVKQFLNDIGYFDRVDVDDICRDWYYEEDISVYLEETHPEICCSDDYDPEKFFKFEYDEVNVFSYFFDEVINKSVSKEQDSIDYFNAVFRMRWLLEDIYMWRDSYSYCTMWSDSSILQGYVEKYGTIEDIEKLTSRENVENYITNIMSIRKWSKEKMFSYTDEEMKKWWGQEKREDHEYEKFYNDWLDYDYGDGFAPTFYNSLERELLLHFAMEDRYYYITDHSEDMGAEKDGFKDLRKMIAVYLDKLEKFEKNNPTDEQLTEFARENTKGMVDFIEDLTTIAMIKRRRKEKNKTNEELVEMFKEIPIASEEKKQII